MKRTAVKIPDALDARFRREAHGEVSPSPRLVVRRLRPISAVEPVLAPDWLRTAELVAHYRDLLLGPVDASVVTVAERLGLAEVGDSRPTPPRVARPNHVRAFALLP
ncbi:MAG: hypothetical protein ACRCYU_15560 [Nocardioides sp.]